MKVRFPTKLYETRYTIVNDELGATFINVQHDDDDWGNLYVSATNSVFGEHIFTLSLERAVRAVNGQVQMAKMQGAVGIFVANVRENTGVSLLFCFLVCRIFESFFETNCVR